MTEIKNREELESRLRQTENMLCKGIITYAEFVFKQAELIHSALVTGIPWAEINGIEV